MKKYWYLGLFTAMLSSAVSANTVVIKNINGYTPVAPTDRGEYRWQSFQTLVMDDGKVVAAGDAQLAAEYPKAKVIDGKQGHMLPGLIDAHGHVLGLGFSRLNVDVRGLKSAKDTAMAVQRYAKQHPELSWIKGRGWNQELWAGHQFPTVDDMDEYVADKPVWLRRVDGHAGWANKKALAFAGIDKTSVDPDGGMIVRDESGEPTGVLIDNAMALLEDKMPQPTMVEKQSALDNASDHLLSVGLTSVHDASIPYDTYRLYVQDMRQNKLNIRLYAMVAALDPNVMTMLNNGYIKDDQEMLSIRSVKLSIDGALGSRGAALLRPYSDRPEQKGLLLVGEDRLPQIFATVLGHHFQLNVHAIGDRGNRVVLDQFEAAFKKYGGKALRNRIEHAQIVSLDDIPRFKTLGIIPSMQPTHATSDMNMAEDRVGHERIKGAYAWRRFLDQGSRIAGGSDFPVEFANPFFGIHAAVTRQDRDNRPKGGWYPKQAMTLEEALRAFTIDAAYAAHQDTTLGSLEKGKWADFIIVDRDVFKIPPQQLWRTKVLQTWIAGKVKYTADSGK